MLYLYKKIFPNVIWECKTDNVLLTIDDTPTNYGTEKILKVLNNKNIKALFFVTGFNAEKNKSKLKEIFSEGHLIGNHSYSHNLLLFKNKNYVESEIKKTDDIIREITGNETTYFRPPYGKINFYKKLNKKTVMWGIFPYDYKNNLEIIKLAIQKCKKNSIIVMHDNNKTENNISRNFNLIIDVVLEKGFAFGDPDKCLK